MLFLLTALFVAKHGPLPCGRWGFGCDVICGRWD
jgi:hypothetical protein